MQNIFIFIYNIFSMSCSLTSETYVMNSPAQSAVHVPKNISLFAVFVRLLFI